jgi:hypothetical protein
LTPIFNLAIVGPDGPVLFGNGIQDEFSTLETVAVGAASGVCELHVIATILSSHADDSIASISLRIPRITNHPLLHIVFRGVLHVMRAAAFARIHRREIIASEEF